MQKLFSLGLSFLICLIFGISDVWIWFSISFVLLSFPDMDESIWEIPLGAMAISVILAFCRDYTEVLTASLIIPASVIFAAAKPRKLLVFYPLVIASLFFFPNSESVVFAMAASLWCACREAFGSLQTTTA